ncbi:MAG TPA: hypothetical protein DCS13_04140 [Candidatus Margulisbacteria bacterium]|nr:MAG: hypothetical protein A2X43_10350 [Candidatus Margulisbacteria bacterium GWD2_39_127]OGI05420.1 MAG: hypothetical protein A2X42_09160 [Candidatus Margulisbacteria bacterium GWF2_38_17]HAR62634.1 hypothetical protein [Candidatus Margulisiibacteriota bacterium]
MKKTMKKTAIIAPYTRPVPPVRGGGVQIGIAEVVNHFKQFKPYVFSVADKELPEKHIIGNAQFIHITVTKESMRSSVFDIWSLKEYVHYCYQIAQYLNEIQPEIIHIRVNPWFVRPLKRFLKYNPKIILQHHTCPFSRSMKSWEIKSIMNSIDMFTGVSGYVVNREVLSPYPVYEKKCRVIYNGINPEHFTPYWLNGSERKKHRASFGIDDHELLLLYVGQIRENKGVLSVIKAFNELEKINKNVKLMMIGSPSGGSDKPDKEQKVFFDSFKKEIANKPAIIYNGFTGRNKIQDLYQMADIFCAPSIVTETFGLVIAEAMASGLPVISSTRGGIPELVGDAGYMVEHPEFPDEILPLMQMLVSDRQLRERIGRSARTRIENNFTWEKTAATTEQIYLELLE